MAKITKHNPAVKSAGKELVITRMIDAPRELVWKAWTNPDHLKRWWGPKNFTSPSSTIDLRVGGKYLHCMRSPEGKDYWSTGVYREIVPLKRLVLTDSFADEKGTIVPASHYGMEGEWPRERELTIILDELNDKTRLTVWHGDIPAAEMANARAGWNESLDKLETELAKSKILRAA